MFSLRDLVNEYQRHRAYDWEPRCKWCGGRPRLRVWRSISSDDVHFQYKCHFRKLTVIINERVMLQDPGAFIRAAYISEPFPLPPTQKRLSPVRPHPYVVQQDGSKAWLMPERTP